ncbi:MAG: hypothetical protein JXR95_02345 [Deltaproteobacteria bacterium]|nr:hypothetical protein [Deltaproteobacteria bacterium]
MKTLVIYSSKHGSSEEFAKIISEKINNCEITSVENVSEKNLCDYNHLVIGSSIYAGKFSKKFNNFIQENLKILLDKKLGVFVIGGIESQYLKTASSQLPESIINHACAVVYGGYKYDFNRMNFFEKFIVKIVSKTGKSIDALKPKNADALIASLNGEKNA